MMKPLNDNAHPLESLLQQHCPNGVEFKELGELELNKILNLGRGKIISQNDLKNCPGEYPVYSSSATKNGEIGKYGKYMFDDERITWSIDGGGKFFYRNHLKYSVTNVCGWIKVINLDELNTKFLFYALINEWVKKKFNYTKKAHPSIIKKEYCIPLPPLEIQYKIVEILDAFTELQAELQAELEARLKQYHYYRNKLLSFEELQRRTDMLNGGGLKLVSLGEIGTFTRGNGLTKADFVEVGVPCIHYGQIHTHYHNYTHSTISFVSEEKAKKLKKAKYGDLVIVGVSEDKDCVCKAVVYLGKQEACVSGDTFIFSHSQNPKFIGYMFQTENFNTFKHKYAQGAKVLRVHNEQLEKFQISLPPLVVQNDIVELLDKFDTLTNDLTSGIPAEIEARKKQYEYYRERLLSFIAKD
ncbi:restriction endonuclease subunit S [Campylobacter upsaliensis]|uniref:restriction endonuclease subunit S n=1 Tax=Campylobacter upsaliensis TaxID=28080 RepID=UPI0022EAEAC4|nr:restriction endonuclease subunit S [Campylobacter upsaliensis]MEB2824267.1 restriction endonuclease subunit S [Campylobacter upsaliensis]